MDFIINENELGALDGLPHIQQLIYLRGIRPYMDVKTGLVGLKRGISYQSIAEQLYIEPHQGIKSESCSRAQVRRALSALERTGILTLESQGLKLILKCELATRDFSVQNKVITKPSQQADIEERLKSAEKTWGYKEKSSKSDIAKTAKADTPLKDNNNYIYLLSQFERFWSLYPEKKSKQSAWDIFQSLNPDEALVNKILIALENQMKECTEKEAHGVWAPPWKHPANWLAKRCFEDVVKLDTEKESQHAKNWKPHQSKSNKDIFWCDVEPEESNSTNNVIPFKRKQ